MTRWLLSPPLSWPHQPQRAPTSRKDSLVASPSTMQATPSTNESLRLIGCFFHLSLNHAGYNEHQRVFMTRWYLFPPLLRPCRSQPAPTSHYDSLVPFFSYPSTMLATTSLYGSLVPFFASSSTTQAITSTNKPLWLVGCFFCFSLDHAGHTRHQRVVTTHWLLFFASTSTITTISLVVVIKYKF